MIEPSEQRKGAMTALSNGAAVAAYGDSGDGEVWSFVNALREMGEALHDRFATLEARVGAILRPDLATGGIILRPDLATGVPGEDEKLLASVPRRSVLADALAEVLDRFGSLEESIVALRDRVDL